MARERFPRRAFDQGVYMPFEDVQLPVPNDSHAYLSALYGDYMQFPTRPRAPSGIRWTSMSNKPSGAMMEEFR